MNDDSATAEQVQALLVQPLAGLGCQLLDVQFRREGKWLLRLVIDRDGGISLEDCAAASELAGRILDVEDTIDQAFQLEVTSPGVFRPLKTLKHFEQSTGKIAKLQLAPEILGERKNRTFRGRIEGIEGEAIIIAEIGGDCRKFPFAALKSARLDPDL